MTGDVWGMGGVFCLSPTLNTHANWEIGAQDWKRSRMQRNPHAGSVRYRGNRRSVESSPGRRPALHRIRAELELGAPMPPTR